MTDREITEERLTTETSTVTICDVCGHEAGPEASVVYGDPVPTTDGAVEFLEEFKQSAGQLVTDLETRAEPPSSVGGEFRYVAIPVEASFRADVCTDCIAEKFGGLDGGEWTTVHDPHRATASDTEGRSGRLHDASLFFDAFHEVIIVLLILYLVVTVVL